MATTKIPADSCTHPVASILKVIDKLGDMTAGPMPGEYTAPILQSHYECRACGIVIPKEEVPHERRKLS